MTDSYLEFGRYLFESLLVKEFSQTRELSDLLSLTENLLDKNNLHVFASHDERDDGKTDLTVTDPI